MRRLRKAREVVRVRLIGAKGKRVIAEDNSMSEYTFSPDPKAVNFQQAKQRLAETDDQKAARRLVAAGWREAGHDEYGEPLWLPPAKK